LQHNYAILAAGLFGRILVKYERRRLAGKVGKRRHPACPLPRYTPGRHNTMTAKSQALLNRIMKSSSSSVRVDGQGRSMWLEGHRSIGRWVNRRRTARSTTATGSGSV